MQLSECFRCLKAANKVLLPTESELKYYCRVFIQNMNDSHELERDCSTEEELFKLVEEVAEFIEDGAPFFIDILTKDCDYDFHDGKATIHWADPSLGKMMTVSLFVIIR